MRIPEKKTLIQFVKFGLVGVSNTVISLFVYYCFLWINEEWYLLGNIMGWIVSVANAFFWNERYVFTSENRSWRDTIRKIAKTYLSYGATFVLSSVLLYIEVEILHWSAVIGPILNLVITIPLNFLLNKFWTFQ